MQKQQSDASLYAVTDDDATIAYLLKTMREMDPEGVGIVRSEFKKYTLRRMHSGNLRQNHRLWRRLQAKMQKLGVLELDVHTVSLWCRSSAKNSMLLGMVRHKREAHGWPKLDLLQSKRHCFGRAVAAGMQPRKGVSVVHAAVQDALCQSLLWLQGHRVDSCCPECDAWMPVNTAGMHPAPAFYCTYMGACQCCTCTTPVG